VRDFSDEQTNLVEIVAGRIAADLEREMLIATGTELKQLDKEINRAARWQHDRLPSVVPLIDQLDIAGWTEQAEGIGGDFHDWSVLPDSRLAIAVADAHGKLVEAGLNAASLHASLKSHAGYRHDAVQMLQRMNDTLWTASAGDQYASLAYGILHPDSTAVELALAGQVAAILVQEGKHQILTTDLSPLGVNPDLRYRPLNFHLEPDDFLLLVSTGVRSAVDEAGLHIGEAAIASLVERHRRESASGMVAHVRRLLDRTGGPLVDDMTVLVVKRLG
jgi:sigma-B regulation protein RsbU (phosphoserine phosphatase)